MFKRLLPTAALPALLLLAACGGGGDDGDSSDTTSGGTPADVLIKAVEGIKYDAKEYRAPAAGDVVVRFENDSSLLHDVYFKDAEGVELPTYLEANGQKTDQKTVKLESGTYELYCRVPGHTNMKATLVVP